MTYTEALQPVSGLTVGSTYQVRSIVDATGFARVYDPTLGGTVAASKANLPTLTVTAQVQQEAQNAIPGLQTSGSGAIVVNGPFKCTITPAAADLVDSSSVTAPVFLMPGTPIASCGDAGGTQLTIANGT